MKLSILVPVYNEEQTIGEILTRLFSLKLSCNKEIIVVDDGSTDKTRSYLNKVKQKYKTGLKIIRHNFNKGKGKAIQSGIKKVSGNYLLIQDADLEYDPQEIQKMLLPVLKRKKNDSGYIAVYGSRFKKGRPSIYPIYYWGNKFLTFLTNVFYGTELTDMETGYKLLPVSFMKSVTFNSSRFEIEPEITARLIKKGIPIVEVPISYAGRSHFAGKKLTVADAFAAIKTLIYLRIT